jgi:hypothetical protein
MDFFPPFWPMPASLPVLVVPELPRSSVAAIQIAVFRFFASTQITVLP